jgi:hypothetical protein
VYQPKTPSDFLEYAIHILFAVVIGISFEISSQIIIPIEEIYKNIASAGILILGYSIIISSWIGYYLSLRENKHKGKLGYVRFALDIFTIYLFYYIINLTRLENKEYRDDVFLYLLPIIYAVYIVWDIVKYYEHKKKNQTRLEKTDRKHRIFITIDYFVWFFVLAIFYYIIPQDYLNSIHKELKEIIFVIISGVVIFRYRYAKFMDSTRVTTRKRILRKQKNDSSNK